MKYALVDNKKTEATEGANGFCPGCGSELIPKCGTINRHHWAHKGGIKCDSWWEDETDWHRSWKNEFPRDWQEVYKFDEKSGKKRFADIYVPQKGLVIEFQNSPISVQELESREQFYGRMIWVINGTEKYNIETLPFKKAKEKVDGIISIYTDKKVNPFFTISDNISNKLVKKRDELIKKSVLRKCDFLELWNAFSEEFGILVGHHKTGDPKMRGPDPNRFLNSLFKPLISRLKDEINEAERIENSTRHNSKYHAYNWPKKPKTWDHSKKHIFIDKGGYLYMIKSDWVLKKISRDEFIGHYRG